MKLQMEVISRETIKPSAPTPHHLSRHALSFIDQLAPPAYMPLTLYFRADQLVRNRVQISATLKAALSQILAIYYPLAGRIQGSSHVDCNDEGAHYYEADVKGSLDEFLSSPDEMELNKFLAHGIVEAVSEPPVAVQANFFDDGGLALSLAITHKIGDALSYFMFLKSWAAIARGDEDQIVKPDFNSAEYFPPKDLPAFDDKGILLKEDNILKRFIFKASSIKAMREKFGNSSSLEFPKPLTRVEALSVFVWKRFMASTQVLSPDKLYKVLHLINLRTRTDPPLPPNAFGNIDWGISATADMGMDPDTDESFGLLTDMRRSLKEIDSDFVKQIGKGKELMEGTAATGEEGKPIDWFWFSSLCRFPVYDADFGWGEPVWVTTARLPLRNWASFFDLKEGDGIEAWITLAREDMVKFEADPELLHYTTLA
uniref:Uncharacterized protein n=1 Tax=Kalanchoe fedtschenkoi TaxID=63787 RepID=A0A7N0VL54_KALFE